MNKLELRTYDFEIRSRADRKVGGYAVLFGIRSSDLGGFHEQIQAGAFRDSLTTAEPDVVALWSHDISKPLASRRAGSLKVWEDERGLAFEMDLSANTTWARDAYEAVSSGTVSGMSFGFRVPKGGDKWDGNERTVTRAILYEISPVVRAAYTKPHVSVRSAAEILAERQQADSIVARDLLAREIEIEGSR